MHKPLPKSLHTVRVLTTMAAMIRRNDGGTIEGAVEEAARLLGYCRRVDDYGLIDKAVAQLSA